jgi:predicted PurR-regulated permease PerM
MENRMSAEEGKSQKPVLSARRERSRTGVEGAILKKDLLYSLLIFAFISIFLIISPALGSTFSSFGFFIIPVVFSLLLLFIFNVIINLIRKKPISFLILFTAIALSAALYTSLEIINLQVENSKSAAELINSSLKKYYSDNNKFPESIDELKPNTWIYDD